MPGRQQKLSSRLKSFFGLSSTRKHAKESVDSDAIALGSIAPETSTISERSPGSPKLLATGGERHKPGQPSDKTSTSSMLPAPDSELDHRITGDIPSPPPHSLTGAQSLSLFPGANNFHLEHLHFINASSPVSRLDLASSEGWKLLLQHTAPNALYDSSARFDPPKCDPDTRVSILEEIMIWIQDHKGPTRLLCLTGAAGAGKSALQQTIAEYCFSEKILASAFFFSTGDYTRNNLSKLVPTMAYQMAEKNIHFRRLLIEAVERDPLIFDKSLRTQLDTLITRPCKVLHAVGGEDLQSFPHAILLDGLDECLDVQRQGELLAAMKDSFLSDPDLPFRIFLASRPEWAVRTALNPAGGLHNIAYHIRLSDDHDATADIRLMLWRRLKHIGSRSDDPRAHSSVWPNEEDIELLVGAASGQFIYAATVVKYVGEVRGSPVDRLRLVLTWTPGQRAKPFAPLDILYSSIMSTAKAAYEAVDTNEYDFLTLFKIFYREISVPHIGPSTVTVSTIEQALGLPSGTYHILLSDLHALVRKTAAGGDYFLYGFYHKSFLEWLTHEERSGSLFVPPEVADAYAGSHILQCIRHCGYQAVQSAAFLAQMAWVYEWPQKPIPAILDHFLDLASEDGLLTCLVESTLDYCRAEETHYREQFACLPASSMYAESVCRGLMIVIANALHSLDREPKPITAGVEVGATLRKTYEVLKGANGGELPGLRPDTF